MCVEHPVESDAAPLQLVSPRTRNRRKPILDSNAVAIGDRIEVQLKKGALQCSVDAKTLGIESVWPDGTIRTDGGTRS